MESGIGNLVDKFSGLGVNDSSKDGSLFQVMKAVEDAESTIKQQVEENNRLRAELQKRTVELESYFFIKKNQFMKMENVCACKRMPLSKSNGLMASRSDSDGFREEHIRGSYETHQSVPSAGNLEDRVRWADGKIGFFMSKYQKYH